MDVQSGQSGVSPVQVQQIMHTQGASVQKKPFQEFGQDTFVRTQPVSEPASKEGLTTEQRVIQDLMDNFENYSNDGAISRKALFKMSKQYNDEGKHTEADVVYRLAINIKGLSSLGGAGINRGMDSIKKKVKHIFFLNEANLEVISTKLEEGQSLSDVISDGAQFSDDSLGRLANWAQVADVAVGLLTFVGVSAAAFKFKR